MNTLINEHNLNEAHEQGRGGNGNFNCWGATLFVLGQVGDLYWAENEEIAEFVAFKTKEITDDIRRGDILVLYSYDRIYHTAVFVDTGEFEELFHKVGGNRSEFTDVSGVIDHYPNYDTSKIVRINN